jgi:hypothetical protein
MSPRSLSRRVGLVLALCAASLLALPVAAGAQGSAAMVRVAHFSPDAPAVDVYVNDDKVLSGVEYKTVSKYLELPTGSYDLAVRPAGAAASSDPVIEATADVEAGNAYTVAAVGALADIQGQIFGDDLSAPASGKAKVRVIHAAPEVPAVDVAVEDGPTLFEGAEFPSATDYAEVDPGTYPVQVKAASGGDVLLEASLPVKAGTIYSVAAVGGAGKDAELLPIVDATGMGQMPGGGVATGAGGTAPGPAIPGVTVVLAGAAVLAIAGLGASALRRRAG